jgi:hypothetical protein
LVCFSQTHLVTLLSNNTWIPVASLFKTEFVTYAFFDIHMLSTICTLRQFSKYPEKWHVAAQIRVATFFVIQYTKTGENIPN